MVGLDTKTAERPPAYSPMSGIAGLHLDVTDNPLVVRDPDAAALDDHSSRAAQEQSGPDAPFVDPRAKTPGPTLSAKQQRYANKAAALMPGNKLENRETMATLLVQNPTEFGRLDRVLRTSARNQNNLTADGTLIAMPAMRLSTSLALKNASLNAGPAATVPPPSQTALQPAKPGVGGAGKSANLAPSPNTGGPGGPGNAAPVQAAGGVGGTGADAKKEASNPATSPASSQQPDRIETLPAANGFEVRITRKGVVHARVEQLPVPNSHDKPDPNAHNRQLASAHQGPSPRTGAKNFGVLNAELAATTHAAGTAAPGLGGGKPTETKQVALVGAPVRAPQGHSIALTPFA